MAELEGHQQNLEGIGVTLCRWSLIYTGPFETNWYYLTA